MSGLETESLVKLLVKLLTLLSKLLTDSLSCGLHSLLSVVEDLNENLIKTIHYFFYPKDGTDQNTEKEPAKEGVLTDLSSQVDHTFRINVSEDLLKNTLFKYPYNDCDVYVIVNLPDGVLATASDHKLTSIPGRQIAAPSLNTNNKPSTINIFFLKSGTENAFFKILNILYPFL